MENKLNFKYSEAKIVRLAELLKSCLWSFELWHFGHLVCEARICGSIFGSMATLDAYLT